MKKAPIRSSDYLWFRPNTSMIWFSRAVPKAKWVAEGQRLLQFSLKTVDLKEARINARRFAAIQDERWGIVNAGKNLLSVRSVPSTEELEEAAVIIAHDLTLEESENGASNLRGKGLLMWRGQLNWIQGDLEEQARLTATRDYTAVREFAELAIEALNWDLPQGGNRFSEFCEILNRVLLDAHKLNYRRLAGDVDAVSESCLVRRVRAREAAESKPDEKIMDLFEKWATECLDKGAKRADTVDQDRKILHSFVQFVGIQRSIDSITAKDVCSFRDARRDVPPKWSSTKELRHLTLREAAVKARKLDMAKTAFTNVNKELSTISPLYKWLARQPRWAGLRNPCEGLHYQGVKGKNRRPPFGTDALNAILASPLFTGFEIDRKEHVVGEKQADDWRKWILLVCMFTGARIGEIAQLRICDVLELRDIWLVQICEEEKGGLTTKNRKGHLVPVHSKLAAIGFLEFVNAQRTERGNQAPLFLGISRDARGQYAKISRWYRDYLGAIGLKQGKDGLGMHSFRHTLTDRLRSEAELLDTQIAVFLDHSIKTTTGGYGALAQGTVPMMKEWIERVTWEGVELSSVMPKVRSN